MSIRIMSAVFARYPAGGNELVLALALADYAHDDGTHIFPHVDELAGKTRLGVRTVQYLLRKMQDAGWLIKCGAGHGGRGRSVTYRISVDWLKGADLAPFTHHGDGPDAGGGGTEGGLPSGPDSAMRGPSAGQLGEGEGGADQSAPGPSSALLKGADFAPFNGHKGATAAAPFGETERVQTDVLKGAIAVAPAIEPEEPPILSPLPPQAGELDLGCAPAEPSRQRGGKARSVVETKAKGREARPLVELQTYLDQCKAAGVKPIKADDPVFAYCAKVGIPIDTLLLHWAEFKRRRIATRKRQKDWPATLRNSVESNWYGLWWLSPDGTCTLSTKGLQAQAFHRKDGDA